MNYSAVTAERRWEVVTMEIRKPNYQMLFNSAVVAKQQAFQKYKQMKAAIDETRRTRLLNMPR